MPVPGQIDPYPLKMRMEAFQRACLDAVAAAGGVVSAAGGPDVQKVDAYISALDGNASLTLAAQLKATAQLEEKNGHILFDLDADTYNRMCDPAKSNTPRILVVMELPADPTHWADCDHDRVLLRRRVFWAHFYGQAPTTNTATTRVKISRDQLLTAATIVPAIKAVTQAFDDARGGAAIAG